MRPSTSRTVIERFIPNSLVVNDSVGSRVLPTAEDSSTEKEKTGPESPVFRPFWVLYGRLENVMSSVPWVPCPGTQPLVARSGILVAGPTQKMSSAPGSNWIGSAVSPQNDP